MFSFRSHAWLRRFCYFSHRFIYWVTVTKIWACEGCEGCTTRKSGPDWRLVCGVYRCVCRGRPETVSELHKLFRPWPPRRSPSYTNFSRPNIGSKSPKFSRRFAPKYLAERFKNALKSLKFSRRFAPKYPSQYPLELVKTPSMGFPANIFQFFLRKREPNFHFLYKNAGIFRSGGVCGHHITN